MYRSSGRKHHYVDISEVYSPWKANQNPQFLKQFQLLHKPGLQIRILRLAFKGVCSPKGSHASLAEFLKKEQGEILREVSQS